MPEINRNGHVEGQKTSGVLAYLPPEGLSKSLQHSPWYSVIRFSKLNDDMQYVERVALSADEALNRLRKSANVTDEDREKGALPLDMRALGSLQQAQATLCDMDRQLS